MKSVLFDDDLTPISLDELDTILAEAINRPTLTAIIMTNGPPKNTNNPLFLENQH